MAKLEMFEAEKTALFDNAPCGYYSIDEQGIIVDMNETMLKWLGYGREEMIGKLKFADIVEGDPQTLNERIVALEKTRGAKTDLNLIKKGGDIFHVILSAVELDGLITSSSKRLFSATDNTRCHEALERIKTLDQELEAFTYSISHDLRAPLRSIDGYSKILQEDYASQLDDEGRRVLNVVMSNARRMGRLIDDLLDFGRLGRKKLQRAHLNMTSIVQNIVQELRMQEPGRKVDVRTGELLPCYADADMMKQVWFNLIENAFKYTSKKDVAIIEIASYECGDREVCYEVRDNGVGFDMQYAGKLFGVFQRLHKMQDFAGTGVGLAIVKRIISRHGGRLWAAAAVNQGATFYFTLPMEHENS